MAGPDQQSIGQYRDAKRFLNPSFLCADLMLAQPKVGFQRSVDLLHRPSSLVCPYHLSRDPLVQIGHQAFRLLRAEVAPAFTQDHSDVADVPQTQAGAIHPEGFPARGAREAGHPSPWRICAGHMGHQVCARLLLDRFPWPGTGDHKASPTSRLVGVALHHHLDVVLRARGRVALDHDACGPRWRDKAADQLTKQGILRLVCWIGFAPNQAKGYREAIHIPRGNPQGKANPEKPRLMLTFPALLSQRLFRPPLGFHTAIAHEIERSVLGRWQGLQGFFAPPRHQQMYIPIGRLEHATQAPNGDRPRRPASQLFQRFPPGEEGLLDHEPTEPKPVAPFPHAGHPATQERNKKGQIPDSDQSRQHRERSREKQESSVSGLSLYHTTTFSLILKAL
jgi:hypothetical protein